MAEQLTLNNPTPAKVPGSAAFTIAQVVIDRGIRYGTDSAVVDPNNARISVVLIGDTGEFREMVLWQGPQAVATIAALNKMDLRANTLNQRILARVQAVDAALAGNITGVPD